ncbi:MAG: UBA/THIF-type binding protein [Actinotalea sp.]|nr:UBA/THIF-type binding protein [Actinotalea sp.]
MRLRAGLPVLWRGPTEVQVGTDPRWSVILGDLSPSAATALRTAPPAAHAREIRAAFERERAGAEVDAVLAHLAGAHLLVPESTSAAVPDGVAWSVLAVDGDGAHVVSARARSTVRIVGLDRIGSALAAHLAASGVGALELDDSKSVLRQDVGPGGPASRDVGSTRAGAAARLVHDLAPGIRTSSPGHRPVDLVVLVEHGVADPLRHRALLDLDAAHLSVVVREASVVVGPLVVPGRSACLRCVDLHRSDADGGWPAIAAQLAGRADERPVETALAAIATGLATAQVLAHLDGRPTSVHDASWEMRLPDVVPRRLGWSPHPDCDCAGPPRGGSPGARHAPVRAETALEPEAMAGVAAEVQQGSPVTP